MTYYKNNEETINNILTESEKNESMQEYED